MRVIETKTKKKTDCIGTQEVLLSSLSSLWSQLCTNVVFVLDIF